MEGLRTLVNGGVAFATPEKNIGDSVKDGASFALNSEYKKDWLKWSPKIAISPGPGHEQNDYPPAFSQHRRLAGHE
jgi:paraquat-inducible protein B